MKRHDNHIRADQLLRVLASRDLTPEEWDRLDMLAGEDPFLADAIEGLKSLPPPSRKKHLMSIQERLEADRKPVRRPVLWLRLAGAAAVLALVASMIWLLPDNRHREEALIFEEEAPSVDLSQAERPQEQQVFTEAEPATAPTQATQPPPPGSAAMATDRPESQRSAPPASAAPTMDESRSPLNVVDGVPTSDTILQADDFTPPAGADLMAKAEVEEIHIDQEMQLSLPLVQGVVQDASGRPLTGVQVLVKGTAMQSRTDVAGNFAVNVPERQLSNALVISHAGYRTVEADVDEGDSVIVKLPNLAAGEASVFTYAAPRQQKVLPDTRAMARPSDGERSYQKYIRENLKYPHSAAQNDIHGTVILEFDLNDAGIPTDFRIQQSVGYGCDEEAIRLIREGPKWSVKGAQVPVGRWEVKF